MTAVQNVEGIWQTAQSESLLIEVKCRLIGWLYKLKLLAQYSYPQLLVYFLVSIGHIFPSVGNRYITDFETSPQTFICSEGGFLDRSEELPPFSPLLPARAPPYADEEVEPERASPPLYVVPSYTEAQVSGQKFRSHICVVFCCVTLHLVKLR